MAATAGGAKQGVAGEAGLVGRQAATQVLAVTKGWFKYRLPSTMLRVKDSNYVGQKQKWFLLRLQAPESRIDFNRTNSPEFDAWNWVEYWYPLNQIIAFKRHVYRKALEMLFPIVSRERQSKKSLTIKDKKAKICGSSKN